MAFIDVNASISHTAKSLQRKSPPLDQSNVFGALQTNTPNRLYDPFDISQTSRDAPNNQENNLRRQSSSYRNSNYYDHPTSPTYDKTSSPSSSSSSFSSSSFSSSVPQTKQQHQEPSNTSQVTSNRRVLATGIYECKFVLPQGAKPTKQEQSAFDKLNRADKAVEYILVLFMDIFFLFVFILFIFIFVFICSIGI
jgi:hypothetical protein